MQSLGLLTAIAVMLRVLLGQLRTEFRGEIGRLDTRVDGLVATMDARFDTVDHRFRSVDARLAAIEADLSLIKGHLIGKRATG
jgi:hypothetical protein